MYEMGPCRAARVQNGGMGIVALEIRGLRNVAGGYVDGTHGARVGRIEVVRVDRGNVTGGAAASNQLCRHELSLVYLGIILVAGRRRNVDYGGHRRLLVLALRCSVNADSMLHV